MPKEENVASKEGTSQNTSSGHQAVDNSKQKLTPRQAPTKFLNLNLGGKNVTVGNDPENKPKSVEPASKAAGKEEEEGAEASPPPSSPPAAKPASVPKLAKPAATRRTTVPKAVKKPPTTTATDLIKQKTEGRPSPEKAALLPPSLPKKPTATDLAPTKRAPPQIRRTDPPPVKVVPSDEVERDEEREKSDGKTGGLTPAGMRLASDMPRASKVGSKPRIGSGSTLYVHGGDEPTASELAAVEEEAIEDRRRLRMALFWILVCSIAMGAYAFYAMDKIRKNIRTQHEQKMREVAAMFPKNPYEYNERQRKTYAKNFWRRFNFRNLALLGSAIMSALFVARWHRMRRVQMHRRKTIAFWIWTFVAGLLGVSWGVYIFKQSQTPIIVKQIKRNPYLRAFLIIGSILLVSLSFYAYKLKNRKSKKQMYLEKWREKKHKAMMNKAKDIRYQDLKPMEGPLGPPKPAAVPSDKAYRK